MKSNVLLVSLPTILYNSLVKGLEKKNKIFQTLVMPMGLLYLSSYLRNCTFADKTTEQTKCLINTAT